jgi:hypothetical protein
MKLLIQNERKIRDIQFDFNQLFPYLKIEFYSKPHVTGRQSNVKFMLHGDKLIGDCRTIHSLQELEILSTMTVADFEQNMQSNFGLGVQVFRQSGKVWLETTITDGWTLEEQNSQGQALSNVAG